MRRMIFSFLMVLIFTTVALADIKLGAIFSITGPASYLGLPEKQTLEMLVEELNKKNGINGEKIDLIIYDDKGEDAEARKKFLRLVQNDKVIAVIGPSRTGTSLAIKELAQEMGIPLISVAASKTIVYPVQKYIFKTPQSDEQAVEKIYDYLKKNGKKKIAIITSQDGFGDTGRNALIAEAKNYELEVVADERFKDTDKDMTSQLSKIAAKKPDAVICWGVGPAPAVIAKNYKQLNMNIPLFMSHGVASKKFIELAGAATDGIYLPAGRLVVVDKLPDSDKYKPILMAYKKSFEAKFNSPVSPFGGYAYDAFHLFKMAVEKAGKDKAKIADALQNIKGFVGVTGVFNMSKDDHNGLGKESFMMIRIKNGEWEIAE
ncbi:ABC transporter substrate-binding protein [Calditerrivibrio sp.]|uniref:ABC transporter substrate-binding protein n=1 Tax=Calditerrivibrio sp. TaxID=2792612 RepID=UPI003D0E599B